MMNRSLARLEFEHGTPIHYKLRNGTIEMQMNGHKINYDFIKQLKTEGKVTTKGDITEGIFKYKRK